MRCFNIRSVIKQMPVRDTRDQPRHWFRPESKKYMTVEMEEPFVWPEQPDLTPWGQKTRRTEMHKEAATGGAKSPKREREAASKLREQARKLLEKGQRRWERRRPGKLTANDERDKFAIKA